MHADNLRRSLENQETRSKNRAYFVFVVFIFFIIILLSRAFYIQVVKHSFYKEQADKQYVSTTPINFDRGSIFLSSYKSEPVPAAQLSTTYRIAIDPTQIKDRDIFFDEIKDFISIEKDFFMEKANKKNDPYEEIAKNIELNVIETLRMKKLSGLIFVKDNKRTYTQGNILSKVLGFVGNDGIRIKGQYGLERYYNDVLSRTKSEESINFFAELFADIEKISVSNVDKQEGDLVLTIDAEVERVLYNTLSKTQLEWKSDTVGGIIMDPNNGEIIAMEGLPSFDPNKYAEVKDNSVFINQNISGVYEMGSIIKPLTMASAFDSKAITSTTTYNDTGFRELNRYVVSNYDGKARGKGTTMQDILDKSLNVGVIFLVEQLGHKKFQEYFKKFGIGSETGIDLPGEASGLTQNLDSNIFVDSATAGFGQGIAITPIQTIRALAILGNGGKLINPHVVKDIIFENGEVKKITEGISEQVISKESSEQISRMLVHVVDNALKEGTYKMKHYTIAAKTGTAQIPKKGGGYYDDRYLHSFFGYFPAYNPKYIIFLYQTYPKGAEYASATLTDPFFELVKFLISYYEIPPDR